MPVDVQLHERATGHEATPCGRAAEPILEVRLVTHVHVRAAISQLAAGRIIAGAAARETEAGIEHVVPAIQPDAAINAELQKLDAVGGALHQVGPDFQRVAAMRVEGIAALCLRLGADRAEHGTDVRIQLSALEHHPAAQVEIQVAEDAVAIFLAGNDVVVAAPGNRLDSQPAPLRRHLLGHHTAIAAGVFVVAEDVAEADVLGLEQVIDHLLVGVARAVEVQVHVARVPALACHVGAASHVHAQFARASRCDLASSTRPGDTRTLSTLRRAHCPRAPSTSNSPGV